MIALIHGIIARRRVLAAPVSYQDFMVFATAAVNPSYPVAGVREIDVLYNAVYYPTGSMTSNTSPAPLVAGNSVLSALAYKAWDGSTLSDPGDMSGTGPWWWKIDLGAGNAIVPAAFRLRCGTSSLVGTIKDGLCLGSNDGVAWVLLASIINQTGWSSSTPRNFVVVANSTQEVIQNVIEYNPQYPDRFESARKYPLIVSKPGTVSYRWKCGGVVIPGQTGATLLAAYSPSPLETPHVREVTLTVDGVSVVHNSNEVILYES